MKKLNAQLMRTNYKATRIHVVGSYRVDEEYPSHCRFFALCGQQTWDMAPVHWLIKELNTPVCKTCLKLSKNNPG